MDRVVVSESQPLNPRPPFKGVKIATSKFDTGYDGQMTKIEELLAERKRRGPGTARARKTEDRIVRALGVALGGKVADRRARVVASELASSPTWIRQRSQALHAGLAALAEADVEAFRTAMTQMDKVDPTHPAASFFQRHRSAVRMLPATHE